MDKQKLIEKIRNVLKHTTENGATPAEAASALALAQKLMAQNGIFMSEVELSEEEKDQVVELDGSFGTKSVSQYQWFLAKDLAPHFACEVLIQGARRYGQRILFIGEQTKATALKECFEFAYNAYQKCFKDYVGTEKNDLIGFLFGCGPLTRDQKLQKRWDYFNGFKDGLTNELIKSENENALVIVKSPELTDYLNKMHITHSTIHTRNIQSAAAREAGYNDGAFVMRNKNAAIE